MHNFILKLTKDTQLGKGDIIYTQCLVHTCVHTLTHTYTLHIWPAIGKKMVSTLAQIR